MKKEILAVLTAIFMIFTAGAETFESVCENLAKHPNMTGNFTQTKTISAVNRTLKSSGTFIFSLDGIMWKTEKPFPSTMVVGMTSVVQTSANGKKTVIDASQNQIFTSISTTLSAMFSGNAETLKNNFNVSFTTSGSTWNATLVPKDSIVARILTSLSIGGNFTAASADLCSILMTEATGDKISYSFTDQKYPKELSADEKAYFIAK